MAGRKRQKGGTECVPNVIINYYNYFDMITYKRKNVERRPYIAMNLKDINRNQSYINYIISKQTGIDINYLNLIDMRDILNSKNIVEGIEGIENTTNFYKEVILWLDIFKIMCVNKQVNNDIDTKVADFVSYYGDGNIDINLLKQKASEIFNEIKAVFQSEITQYHGNNTSLKQIQDIHDTISIKQIISYITHGIADIVLKITHNINYTVLYKVIVTEPYISMLNMINIQQIEINNNVTIVGVFKGLCEISETNNKCVITAIQLFNKDASCKPNETEISRSPAYKSPRSEQKTIAHEPKHEPKTIAHEPKREPKTIAHELKREPRKMPTHTWISNESSPINKSYTRLLNATK
jgi:hypothetical protein